MASASNPPLVAPISLVEQVEAARSGQVALPDAVADLLARIDDINPQVRAMLPDPRQRERLAAEAEAIAQRWPDPDQRPPLYGALAAVKDIFNVDRMPTRAGSAVPPESFSGREADVVARLRDLGALIVGKTVTTEFAYFAPGATVNPHDRGHTPGGSSSGSAAAVASGMAAVALGSQTVGSVIRPASFCGVVGYKPSYDRIASGGMLYFSRSVDHVGFFVRSAADAVRAASALLVGWRDGEDAEAETPRIGIPTGPYLDQAGPEMQDALSQAAERLRDVGLSVESTPTMNNVADVAKRHGDLNAYEFAQVHEERYARYGAMFRPESAQLYERGRALHSSVAEAGRTSRIELRQRLHQRMDRAGIDAWLCPSAVGPAPRGLSSTGDPAMNMPWTHAGMPVISLPFGAVDGLPLGLQLVGRFGHDETLLGQALAVEAALIGDG